MGNDLGEPLDDDQKLAIVFIAGVFVLGIIAGVLTLRLAQYVHVKRVALDRPHEGIYAETAETKFYREHVQPKMFEPIPMPDPRGCQR